MLNLQRLEMFVTVVTAGSFTRAAQQLSLSKAVVSFNIKQLEAELEVSLLSRSTRRIAMTDAGERFYHRCRILLQDAEGVLEEVRKEHGAIRGQLRLTTTPEYGAHVVVPALAAFTRQHPGLAIHHVSSSQHDDLISGRFDLAIRMGELPDTDHHAALVDTFDIMPVAAPDYLRTTPIHSLADLAQADWIAHSRLPMPLTWRIETPEGQHTRFNVLTPPMRVSDNASALMAFALSASGVAVLPDWLIRREVQAGRLVHVLPAFRFPQQHIYALYPRTRHVPQKVRAFIDFLREQVAAT